LRCFFLRSFMSSRVRSRNSRTLRPVRGRGWRSVRAGAISLSDTGLPSSMVWRHRDQRATIARSSLRIAVWSLRFYLCSPDDHRIVSEDPRRSQGGNRQNPCTIRCLALERYTCQVLERFSGRLIILPVAARGAGRRRCCDRRRRRPTMC
jgi:hypothetical protein